VTSDARGPGDVPGASQHPRRVRAARVLALATAALLLSALACRHLEPIDEDLGSSGEFEIAADAKPGAGPAPLTIQFKAEAANARGGVRWHWDFADGATSDEQSPRHTYTTAAPYDVRVTATDRKGHTDWYVIHVRAWTPEEWKAGVERHNPRAPQNIPVPTVPTPPPAEK
jgi:hypothetical protein